MEALQVIDENRLNRVHVVNVRGIDGKFYVILSDGDRVLWEQWINLDRKERWGY